LLVGSMEGVEKKTPIDPMLMGAQLEEKRD
jgi:hypothetical protein